MDLPREVAILDECSSLCMRKRKSLISKYRSFDRLPRILAFASAGFAMTAAVLMAGGTIAGLSSALSVIIASGTAVLAGLLALSSVAFFSAGQLVDAVEGASSFLTLSNKCQIERERGIASGGISLESIKDVITEFNALSARFDRMLPLTVGNLSLPKAADLPAIRFQNITAPLVSAETGRPRTEPYTAANDETGVSEDVSDTMLDQIDQIIDDIKSTDTDESENLADFENRRRQLSSV